MRPQFENTVWIPLVIDETTIAKKIKCKVICALGYNEEPYVTAIAIEDQDGGTALYVEERSIGDAAMLWTALKDRALEAVAALVAAQMREDIKAETHDRLANIARWWKNTDLKARSAATEAASTLENRLNEPLPEMVAGQLRRGLVSSSDGAR